VHDESIEPILAKRGNVVVQNANTTAGLVDIVANIENPTHGRISVGSIDSDESLITFDSNTVLARSRDSTNFPVRSRLRSAF
jgi:hypothetical protein